MKDKKVFILVSDGSGLRNFLFTKFKAEGENSNYNLQYWNDTRFSLSDRFNCNEVSIATYKQNWQTLLFCRVRKRIELNVLTKKFKDNVYQLYKFPLSYRSINDFIKSTIINVFERLNSTEAGIKRIRKRIKTLERSTKKYAYCKQQLTTDKPDLVFCTNQRSTKMISAVLAAQDLGIPTVCFIHSWDNVPKAMNVIETDYYLVWSDLMKKELLHYYPYIDESKVFVTGTPQFVPHYDRTLIKSRASFFNEYNLDVNKKYVCYSGDDITTSPLDQYYLEDLTNAVRNLNNKGENIGIIYRKCPVDFTDRYDEVLKNNKDLIIKIDPIWEQVGDMWSEIIPTVEDFSLLANICYHTELVTNVCSSTVFDFVIHKKPCIYYNYEQPQLKKGIRDIGQNYKYVHFRSMPSDAAVIWCKDKSELETKVFEVLKGERSNVSVGTQWYHNVVGQLPENACATIWNALEHIILKTTI
ncbi:glycosyltransferase family protein [Ichthyenterobacterium magnum]|nr:UDP-glycosyltransferase [Ichthyenterobacterium magnum]